MNRNEWIEMVLREIRFAPDRRKIRQELLEHMEDRLEEYEDEQRVLESMGDPTEVGRELNQQHKPWLGWLWMASWAALAVTAVLTLVLALVVGINSLTDKPDTLDLEETYAAHVKYYDTDYNHSGDICYNWQTDHAVELLDTELPSETSPTTITTAGWWCLSPAKDRISLAATASPWKSTAVRPCPQNGMKAETGKVMQWAFPS